MQRRIDALLDEADAAITASNWTVVAEKARAVLAIDEANEDAAGFLKMAEANGVMRGEVSQAEQPSIVPVLKPAPALPSSFAAGRYAVRRFLGEGGRKRVYLAHDSRLDREVAFCVIRAEGLDRAGHQRVLREAQSVARLGQHPNLVTVHDIGEDAGNPYLVQEYMAGGDVAGLIEKAEDHRVPVERTLAVAKDVCRGLSFIHAGGMVHRDLKPANVFLSANGTAKVGDFGLAVALDRSRLTLHGMMLGTVSYMPPEQALGGESTLKADLYSLGAMLYEMVSGRPPFLGDDPTAVISQHINTPPVAPSWVTEHCPPSLEEVILKLLEKDPGQRPANAAEVLAALEKVDPNQKSASHSDSNVLDRLARGVFVGREKELERLRKAFDEAFAGHGGLVMLVGEPGIGKTRTTHELETYARMRGATVLWGRTHESAGAPPYWPWIQVGNQWVAQGGLPGSLQLSPDTIGQLSRIFPTLRQLPNFVEPQTESDPAVGQFRLFDAYADFLRAVAANAPLVIALDDLHWADRSTLLLFQHLSRNLATARLFVVGTYRTLEVGEDHALVPIFADLRRERLYEGLDMDALSPLETASMVRFLTNRNELPPAFLQAVYDRTEGNPFFVEEVIRHLQSEGREFDDPALASSDWGLPEGARQVIGSRLACLSPEVRRLLQAAAVLGDDFILMFPVVGRMLALEVSTLGDTMEGAVRAGMLRGDGKSYRFAHALIRDAILQQMSLPMRQNLHLRAAEAMEQVYTPNLEPRLPAIAAHYRFAGPFAEGEKAIDYSVRAGEAAETALAYDDAQLHWEAALDLMERHRVENTVRVRLVERLGELMQVVGFDNYGKSAGYFEQALALHEKTGDAAGAAAMHARLGLLLGAGGPINDNPAALRHLQAAAPLIEDGPASDAQLSFYSALGLVAVWQVHTKDGLASSMRAMEIALELGEEDRWVTNAVMHSYHLHAEGRLRDGFKLMTRAWEIANRLNNTYRAFVVALWLGDRLMEMGDPLEARGWYQKEVSQPRQVHAPTRRRSLQRSIAATFACAGDMESCQRTLADEGIHAMPVMAFFDGSWDESEAVWIREREAAPAGLDRSSEATAEYWLARVRRLRGDAAGAVGLLSDALGIGLDGPSLLVQLMASAELAIVLAESGRPEKSEVHLARCREILAGGEDWRGLAGRVALAEAIHAAASGCAENASERFELAIGVFRRLSLPWDEAEAFETRARSCKRFYRGRTRRAFLLETLNSARAIYERIHAGQPWLDRLDAYGRDVMGVADLHTRGPLPDHLTPREAEILRLIAAGKSGKEIGAELVLSVRTVERHIANIYLKTSLHGRAQVANYATAHGLGAPVP